MLKLDKLYILRYIIAFYGIIFYSRENASCQNQLNFAECGTSAFCVDCGKTKAEYQQGSKDILSYLQKELSGKHPYLSISDEVVVQVIVDTTGNICCKSISNLTNASLEKIGSLELEQIFIKMPKWKPAMNEDKPLTVSIILYLTFEENKGLVKVTRSGALKLN